ncbi:MAG: leucine-rich repeat protein [Ruminococcus sp.]|nr:leucine-rich repeat protein [Ruminococcus sp.]
MKKIIIALTAILCVAGGLAVTDGSPLSRNNGSAVVAYAADAEGGKYEDAYSYPYADSSVYTTKLATIKINVKDETGKTVDANSWVDANNGNTYSIYKVTVTSTENRKTITNTEEYRIAITKPKETTLDVTMNDVISVPDNVKEYFDNLGKEITGNTATVIAPSAFASSYLKTINLDGVEFIGLKAFSKCQYITEITIPESVKFIDSNTFENSGLKTLSVQNEMPVIPDSLCASTKLTNITFAHPEYIRHVGSSAFKATPVASPFFSDWYGKDTSNYEYLTIDDNAFENCTSIKSVKMPDNLIALGKYVFKGNTSMSTLVFGENTIQADQECFRNCTALDSITFNKVLDSLGGCAFQGCVALKSITGLPNTLHDWTPEDKTEGRGFAGGVFQGCTSLVSADLPASLTRIPQNCFSGCLSLKTVYNAGNIVKIKEGAFKNCSNLLEAVYMDVTEIEKEAFSGCSSLHTVAIPKADIIGKSAFKDCSKMQRFSAGACTKVEDHALDGCSSMTEITLLADKYGEYVFANCTKAKSVSINTNGMEKIPVGMFSGCSFLTGIDSDISNISIIGKEAFANCTGLTNIDFPSLRIIEESGFQNCTSLKSISASDNAIKAEDYGAKCFQNCTSLTVSVSGTISTIGANAFEKSGITDIDLNGMTGGTVVFGNSAFAECPNLTHAIILSENVADFSAGTGIFMNCPVVEVIIYEGPIITANMFKGCPVLSRVETNATTINANAFENCRSLVEVDARKTYPTTSIIAKEIASGAFKNCSSLAYLPSDTSTTFSGKEHYYGCTSLTSVQVSTLTESMFSGCTNLSNVSLKGVLTVPKSAFQNCTSLKDIDIKNFLSIGASSFAGSGLTSVTIDNAQTIDISAFNGCNSLKTINVSAKDIGKTAFANCLFLEKAEILAETIGESAFSGDVSLRDVTLQSGASRKLTSIGAKAFLNCNVLMEAVVTGSPVMGTYSLGFINNSKVNPDFLLVGETGSTVQTYAEKSKIAFQDINSFDLDERRANRNTPGDVDGNGIISAPDAVKLQSWVLGRQTTGIVTANMDLNGDGNIDVFDVVLLRQKVIENK